MEHLYTITMRKHFNTYWVFIKRTFVQFLEHDSFSHASSIAFSTIFSLPAILIIALSLASQFFEKELVQDELLHQFERLIGNGSAQEIKQIIQNSTRDTDNIIAGLIGLATLIFSATTVFIALQSSLNSLWGIKPKPQKSWLKFIVNRLLSFAMVMSFGFVLLVSLLIEAILAIFQNRLSEVLDGAMTNLLPGVNLLISLLIITFIFALIFKVLPDAKIRWRDLWVGAFITALLFTAGKYLIGLYLGNSGIHSAYGAAGSFVVILFWVYFSTIIFLFGAALTREYAAQFGTAIEPYADAVSFKIVEMPHDDQPSKPRKE
ncbi:MAG: membrane protein [Cyclobacteriaceae bacterium]